MGKFDFEKMKGNLQGVAGSVANAAKGAVDSVATATKGAADSVSNAAKGIKVPDIFARKEGNKTEKDTASCIPKEVHPQLEGKSPDMGTEGSGEIKVSSISTKNAIKIIYYMMAVDGQIHQNEEEKFDEICMELDPDYPLKKDDIIRECRNQLDKQMDDDDYYDVIQDGVEDAIISSMRTENSFITPKILVWDLLTIAYSDDNYDAIERKLLKYIVRKLDIDKAVFSEMESSILTLMDLEKELNQIERI